MDLGLKGKKAIVCASSKGLGLAVAKELAAEGSSLVLCARNQEELSRAVAEISELTGRGVVPHALVADLSDPKAINDFAMKAMTLLGGIDILVNNIGGPPPSSAENYGRIITITSLSVLEPIDHLVVSTAMRTAVTAFMKTLSKELAPFGITANTVLPGVIHTDRIVNLRKAKASRDGTTLAAEMEKSAKAIPMGRLGRPEELAGLVAFLASSRASYMTGTNIPVDGGLRHSW